MDTLKSAKIMKNPPMLIKKQLKEDEKNNKIYIEQEICTGCGLCREVCPFGLPERNENKKFSIIRLRECIECSACKRNCPVQAIIMIEKAGCGCLYDVRNRTKLIKKRSSTNCCS